MTWRIEKQQIYPLEGAEASLENVVEKVLENVDAGEDNRNAQDYAQDGQVRILLFRIASRDFLTILR